MKNKNMKLILGTMNFGPQVNDDDSLTMVQKFLEAGYDEIDSAYVYNEGETERILGRVLPKIERERFHLSTKANPRVTGKLDAKAVRNQLDESLSRMNRKNVDILYLHFPDPTTPIEETLKACAELYDEGKFLELGLSNFPAWLVVDIWHICDNNNWPKPKVYQGMYNGLSRNVEKELFPALKKLGIKFYAYNPLAGGLLSGKYSDFNDSPIAGRFTLRPNYKDRYWKKSFFEALNELTIKCQEVNLKVPEAAFRWLTFHSNLDSECGDGIVIGASKVKQLEDNISALSKGPLPKSIQEAFTSAWEEAKADSPDYFRLVNK
jgi:aflatoxin B1 aldehyde reductase